MEVIFCDKNPDMVEAWTHFFGRTGNVTITNSNVLDLNISALVVPTNSFAMMDHGVVGQLNVMSEGRLESRCRKLILDKYAGELPVGLADIITTDLEKPPLIILAPVVRAAATQEGSTVNPYLATRAALRAAAEYVRSGQSSKTSLGLESVAFVGMNTGDTGLGPPAVAFQMYEAYCQIVLGQLPNFATPETAVAHDTELRKMRFI